MINLAKLTVILISIIFSLLLGSHLTFTQTDITKFFPQTITESTVEELKLSQRYLFVSSHNPGEAADLEQSGLVKQLIAIPSKQDEQYNSLLIYSIDKQPGILQFLKENKILGPPVIGAILSKEFVEELLHYLWLFIPVIILGIFFLTGYRFLLNALLEIALFSVLLLGIIQFYSIELNPASLLALLFVYIYVFTLLNQLYFNKLDAKSLRLSFIVSVATTWLSGILLYLSDFGLVSDFGYALTIWISVLAFYLAIRLQFIDQTRLTLNWFRFKPIVYKASFIWTGLLLLGATCLVAYQTKPVAVELNPLSLSSQHQQILQFEADVSLAQPFMMQIHSNECSLRELECTLKYQNFIAQLFKETDIKYRTLFDMGSAYRQFSDEPLSATDSRKFSQFKLANDMMGLDRFLFGNDGRNTFFIGAISLLEPVSTLVELKTTMDHADLKRSGFTVKLLGHTSMAETYQNRFILETAYSLFNILLLLSALFAILFKRLRALVTLLPIALSLMIFMLLHMIFGFELSVISLISAILFVGIVSDNLIHIALTYKNHEKDCFRTVFKPVVLSNLIMIASLMLMAFFMQGVLHFFGMELAILLCSHLLLSILLLPTLFRTYLSRSPA
ncbi:hypothetical protein [Thiomicrorhabdus sp. 6S3-12]|uniref:hypothetical protein n=1 Tax=Thiomicrorhabdus sp. 6S3-12 TaxID=2819681 RepID=UPI001AAC579F|nr:hypothetical protein [Thiomicrorhabdus sp. 6S3-12]MBO1925011.1 hypothetical protein [Thiomicrorhabdus sp. 6S3-12]